MADKKISQLTGATTPLSGAEVLPIVQSGSTVKVSVNDLTVGKAVVTKTIATSTTNLADNATFESTTNTGIYVRWKRPNKSYILSLDINNNGGKNFSIFDETASATRFDISDGGDITVGTGNLIQGTAAKGVTTGGSFSLGLGTNGSTSQATLDTSGNFVATGAVSGTNIYSYRGSVPYPTGGVATTIFTMPSDGLYAVYFYLNLSNDQQYSSFTYAIKSGSTTRLFATNNGALLTITLSGSDIQATHGVSGYSVSYAVQRIF